MVVFVGDWRIMIEMEVDVGYVDETQERRCLSVITLEVDVWQIGDDAK